jgi:hypothetical protein
MILHEIPHEPQQDGVALAVRPDSNRTTPLGRMSQTWMLLL